MLLLRVTSISCGGKEESQKAHVDKDIADTVATFSTEQAAKAEADTTLAKEEAEKAKNEKENAEDARERAEKEAEEVKKKAKETEKAAEARKTAE